jgi:hypothetical protein
MRGLDEFSVMTGNRRAVGLLLWAAAFVAMTGVNVMGQGFGPGGPPQSPKAGAPSDLTGYWVSVVVEDWRYRMLPPTKVKPPAPGIFGGGIGVPVNPQGLKVALAWDPDKDEAAGEQCKSYGATNLMRVPGRLHITWQDDQTLKIETDAGTQTRLFHFGPTQDGGGDWQGVSHADWEALEGLQVPGLGRLSGIGSEKTGSLKVVTTKLKPGYLRKNGIPYSDKAVLTEYYDVVTEPDGATYLLITSTVEDPVYLMAPYQTTTHFRKQSDGSGWSPSRCTSR